MSDQITRLNPATMPDSSAAGYSQISIVEAGRVAHVSGQVAASADGAPVPDDLAGQVRVALVNAGAALGALGATPRDIAIARVYVTDLTSERLAVLMPQLTAFFDGARPSLTGIGVAALASPAFQVEIELTVRVPDQAAIGT